VTNGEQALHSELKSLTVIRPRATNKIVGQRFRMIGKSEGRGRVMVTDRLIQGGSSTAMKIG
jgi:hypothetical protein